MSLLSSIVIIQDNFSSHTRSLAAGICSSGLSLGTIVMGPILHHLTETFTWRGALLLTGGFALNLCVCGCLYRPAIHKTRSKKSSGDQQNECLDILKHMVDFSLLKQPTIALYLLAIFLQTFCLGTLSNHLPSRAYFYGLSSVQVAWLPTVLGMQTSWAEFVAGLLDTLTKSTV